MDVSQIMNKVWNMREEEQAELASSMITLLDQEERLIELLDWLDADVATALLGVLKENLEDSE